MKCWDEFISKFPLFIRQNEPYNFYIENSKLISTINLLFYHTKGFPIYLFIDEILKNKFNTICNKTFRNVDNISFYEAKHYHEFKLTKTNNNIIKIIQSIVSTKHVIQNQKHIFIIHNIELLPSQIPFRILCEKYQYNATFIATTNCISKIELPLKSRFYGIRIPLFTKKQLCDVLNVDHVTTRNLFHNLVLIELNHKYSKYLRYPPIVEKQIKSIEDAKELAKAYDDLELTCVDCAMDLLEIAHNDKRKHFILNFSNNLDNNLYSLEALTLTLLSI